MQQLDQKQNEYSPKLRFLIQKLPQIVELEQNLKNLLSEESVKRNPTLLIKLCEGGWIQAKEVFEMQEIFSDEKTFFQALCFIRRINVSQIEILKNKNEDSSVPQASIQNLISKTDEILIKLNENIGNPSLNFQLQSGIVRLSKEGKPENSDQHIKQKIENSVFNQFINKLEISNKSQSLNPQNEKFEDKENLQNLHVKVHSDYSSVVSGLKCFLQEQYSDIVYNISEDYFNINAKPFVPKEPSAKFSSSSNKQSIFFLGLNSKPLQSSNLLEQNELSKEEKEKKENLEKKRQISQMYQYYNYLIFEKNKESFNDINPDLRKMTYKYDSEVKNAYMTVQASPEVIKAAMGMNQNSIKADQPSNQIQNQADKSKKKDVKKYGKDQIQKVFENMIKSQTLKSPIAQDVKNLTENEQEINQILIQLMKKEVVKTELICFKEGNLGPSLVKND